MQCPYCGGDSNVTETRVTVDGGMRRRRVCTACKRRFTTYERLGPPGLKVAKRDGTIEPFELDKLLRALRRVCAHRPGITDAALQRVARDIEAKLVDSGRKSVTWSDLATHVLDRLANLDPVAAQRFAANYTDESGAVRFDRGAQDASSHQLGLPLLSDEE
jgi:transcriptional repressor NrdR